MSDRKALQKAIAREEELLAQLDAERGQAFARIDALKTDLALIDHNCSEEKAAYAGKPSTPKSSTEKVSLFRNLFRGRNDVYPRLWISRTGKKGYAPACSNDWISGFCGKTLSPPVKCGQCTNRKFLPVTDKVILYHLQGRHVIGVYPMLDDDTCWFLEVPFNGYTGY